MAHGFDDGKNQVEVYSKDAVDVLLAAKEPAHQTQQVTLLAANWSLDGLGAAYQEVTCSGVTAENVVIVSPIPGHTTAYTGSQIVCSAQAANSLRFICDPNDLPAIDITVNVLILG